MTDYELSPEYLEMCQLTLNLDQRNLMLDFMRGDRRYIPMARMSSNEKHLLDAQLIEEKDVNIYVISARGVRWMDVNDRFMVGYIRREMSRGRNG